MPQTANIKIKRRDDLIPAAVALKFRITSTNDGSPVVQVVNDIATTISGSDIEGIGPTGLLQLPADFIAADSTYIAGGIQTSIQNNGRSFASQIATLDMEGSQTLSATITAVTVDVGDPGSDSSAKTFWTTLFPELADVANLAFYDVTNKPATVTDESGAAVDLTIYTNRLTKGQIAPWMNATGGPGLTKKCTVKAYFKYDQNNVVSTNTVKNASATWHEKTATVTLTNLAGGTYAQTAIGEIVPYGLAGYIYAIESILQYEGSLTIQEIEITDQCPLGNNLNISGGLAEWTAMNACIQQITYDLDRGTTALTFGPAGHLGAKDLVERLRVNRGPRWLYSIGSNIVNATGSAASLGNYTPDQGPSHNNAVKNLNILPNSLDDWLPNNASYTEGTPGVTHDALGTTSYDGGITGTTDASPGTPGAPVVHLASGSSGSITHYVHLNANGVLVIQNKASPGVTIQLRLADLPSGFASNSSGNYVIKLREVTDCVLISEVPTQVYRQALVSEYYTSPLGNI